MSFGIGVKGGHMSHYFDDKPQAISNEKKIDVFIRNNSFSFFTDNAVFSKNGLDFGTRTLLESIDLDKIDGFVLDFGCGYGPIGIFLAFYGKKVDMIDINERALGLAKKNLYINHVKANVFKSDVYANVKAKYDFIITNPPIRVGKELLYKILFDAKEHLKRDGHLIFVIHKDQGAKTLAKKMEEIYTVNILNKHKGFFVIDCQNC